MQAQLELSSNTFFQREEFLEKGQKMILQFQSSTVKFSVWNIFSFVLKIERFASVEKDLHIGAAMSSSTFSQACTQATFQVCP